MSGASTPTTSSPTIGQRLGKRKGEEDGSMSLFDRPTPALAKIRRDAVNQREKGILPTTFGTGLGVAGSIKTSPPSTQRQPEVDQGSNWTVYEDYLMINVSSNLQLA